MKNRWIKLLLTFVLIVVPLLNPNLISFSNEGFTEPMPDFTHLLEAGWQLEFGSNFPLNDVWGFTGNPTPSSVREGTADHPINHFMQFNVVNQSGGRAIARELPSSMEGSMAYVTFDWRPGTVNIHGSSEDQNVYDIQISDGGRPLFSIRTGANGQGGAGVLTTGAFTQPIGGFNHQTFHHENFTTFDDLMALSGWQNRWYTVGVEFNFDNQELELSITERGNDIILVQETMPFNGTEINHFRIAGHRTATNNITLSNNGFDNLYFFSRPHTDDTIISVIPPGFLPAPPATSDETMPQSWFINVPIGTSLDQVGLPETIEVITANEEVVEVNVEWEVTEVPWAYNGTAFNPDEPGVFTFTGIIGEPVEGQAVNRMMIEPNIFVEVRRNPTEIARGVEWLDRGVIAVPVYSGEGILVRWRLLATEYNQGLTFNILRNGEVINNEPIALLNFVDDEGAPGDEYQVEVIQTGEISDPTHAWENNWMDIPLQRPAERENPAIRYGAPASTPRITYTANDMAVADVNGDGQFNILVKWDPSEQTDPGLANRHTGETIFDLYTLEGELLWRINMGINITSSAHHSTFNFFDLDQDGLANFAVKTAEGTRVFHPQADGTICDLRDDPVYVIDRTTNGSTIGNANAVHVGQLTNPVTGAFNAAPLGRVNRGPEFLTVFDGLTGLPIYTIDYFAPYSINAGNWGDTNNNRSDRFLGGVAFFPKYTDPTIPYPSIVEVRGHYGPHFVAAYQLIEGELIKIWEFRLSDWASGIFGNHNLSFADIDGDGFDEVILGSIVLRYDGTPFWISDGSRGTTRATHGDALHVGAFLPNNEILVMTPLEMSPPYNARVFNGRTGESIWKYSADSNDVGRGIAANITPLPGFEVWVGDPPVPDAEPGSPIYNLYSGERIEGEIPGINFRIFWTGDLLSELLDGRLHHPLSVTKFNYNTGQIDTIQTFYGTNSNNHTKANPGIQADILGDWREEVIVRTACQNYMRLYATNIPTEFVIYTLMHDPAYRLQVNAQNSTYNQPPHLSFYLGEDIRDEVLAMQLPTPNVFFTNEPEPTPTCEVVAYGQFAGAEGSQWRICENGRLEIDEGFINWTGALSPWHAHRALITQIEIGGQVIAGPSLRALFRELTEVEGIAGLTYFDTTATTTMYRMFFGASGVRSLDVTSFDTRNVTSMALMFRDASSLVDLDVSEFETGNVTDMREMFRGTGLTQLDLLSFDTGNVTNMNHMFVGMNALSELTLGEHFAFIGNPGLPTVRQTAAYTGLWEGAELAFTSAQLMVQFDGSTMAGTFVWQEWQPTEICEVVARGRFASSADVTGSQWILCEDGTLEVEEGFINWTLTTSPWHAHRANITEIVFTGPITGGASLRSLFHDLFNLTAIEGLTYLDTSDVTNMGRMFRGASSLTELDLSNFDTSSVVDMGWMFFGASGLESLDVTGFNTSNVTDMALMFRETSSLPELDVTNFNTSNVLDMREMFRGASSLTALDLSSFDTKNIQNMNHMFTGTISMRELTLGTQFSFIGSPGLPRPGAGQTAGFTGRWQNIGDGTASDPTGEFVLTSTQLMSQFNGSTMADTFVWQFICEICDLPIAMFGIYGSTMDRGVVAAAVTNGVFLSWRYFPQEATGYVAEGANRGLRGTTFAIYRNNERIAHVENSTNFHDDEGSATDEYVIVTVGEDGSYLSRTEPVNPFVATAAPGAGAGYFLSISLERPAPARIPSATHHGEYVYSEYNMDEVLVGDLTGNGQLDFVVKWQNQNYDVIQPGFFAPVLFRAYTITGEMLWEINMGPNIRAGQHYSQPMLYDFDGDGRAELMVKTAPGTVDGLGNFITLSPESIAAGYTHYDNFQTNDGQFWREAERILNAPHGSWGGLTQTPITPAVMDAATPEQIAEATAVIEQGAFFQYMQNFFYTWNENPEVVGRSYWGNPTGETEDGIGWWVQPPHIMLGMYQEGHVCPISGEVAAVNGVMYRFGGPYSTWQQGNNGQYRRSAPGWQQETFGLLSTLPTCPREFRDMEITEEIAKALTWQWIQNSLNRASLARNYHNWNIPVFNGYIISGPEYFTVFNGETGAEMGTIPYLVPRDDAGQTWNDFTFFRVEPANRVDRHLGAVARLDGHGTNTASAIQIRGYYSRTTVMRYDWDGTHLTGEVLVDTGAEVMNNPFNARANYFTGLLYHNRHGAPGRFESAFDPNNFTGERAGYEGTSVTIQGQHSMTVWDLDWNDPDHWHHGRDTIIIGAAAFYYDGTTRWTGYYTPFRPGTNEITPTGELEKFGHGDSMHFAYMHPNQEIPKGWMAFEGALLDEALINAATGEVLYFTQNGTATQWNNARDNGRAMIGDFTNEPGWQLFTRARQATPLAPNGTSHGLRQFDGHTPSAFNLLPGTNASIFWGADLSTQTINNQDNPVIRRVNAAQNGWEDVVIAQGAHTHGGTKGQPAIVVDFFGDYREELLLVANRGTDNQELRIYFNTEISEHMLASLMTDRRYRVEIARQNTVYNQPTYPSFYFGRDMDFSIYFNTILRHMMSDPEAFTSINR